MRISIIIPVHNGAAFLPQTLLSVLNQGRVPDEVIVVDDGSSDESAKTAEGFGPQVSVIRGCYGGAAAARVAGVAHATGDALMFMDADDLLGLDVISALEATLSGHDGAIACCDWLRYERIGATWQAQPASCAPRRPGQNALSAWLTGWYHPPCSVLWSRKAYDTSGGWNPKILVNNDGDLMMRALAAGIDLVKSPHGTSYYRRLPDGAVSLSGRRFTPEGLTSRMQVLDGLSHQLSAAGFPEGTRAALAEAYGNVAGDSAAVGQDELASQARKQDRRHGGTPAWAVRRKRADRNRQAARAGTAGPKAATAEAAPAIVSGLTDPPPDAPRVSVVIPAYNRATLLRRAIASVVVQDFSDFELLVIDDASTEDLQAVVAEFDDSRLRYIRQPQNGGVAAARNRGIVAARAPLVAFLDSDDEWLAGKLSAQVAAMDDAPRRVGLIHTGLIERGSDGAETIFEPTVSGNVWTTILHRNTVHYGTSSVIIRRRVIDTTGGFDETLPAIEDWDLWIRIAQFFEFRHLPQPLMIYHDESLPAGSSDSKRSRDFAANMEARRILKDRYGDALVRAGTLHRSHLDSARRHLEMEGGRQGDAIVHLLKAIRRKPGAPRLYVWLAFAGLPPRVRRGLFPTLTRLRTRIPPWLWLGRDM
ncbi:glycosyltransferase family 2 protein [Palleronia abyssalis]|uniref:GalNAc(5)-diNAcBac-PP-undecaprenol beta-1,3-glucosyltransferase n=1 Tax=Palleronia abyssalis TaxID=1501240 RepID=A0A2R8BZM8_9RHOB|nr:glycosyltransferase [Palleronia abyssalis]SPJ25546.1 GalNAc(5)-diNAcBac-PP-undecaprenol beta-1,3-glucosyltransferase [Palleronia abyssalis]